MDSNSDVLIYEVVKEHHRLGWLYQNRTLKLTDTAVYNCKPNAIGSGLIATKSFSYETITSVAVNGATKFCLKVENDHTYFYSASNALQIALDIQKRVSAWKAIKEMSNAEDEREILMRSFCRGELQLPQFTDETARKRGMSRVQQQSPLSNASLASSSTTHNRLNTAESDVMMNTFALRLELGRAFREGVWKTSHTAAKKLKEAYLAENIDFICLQALREDLDEVTKTLADAIHHAATQDTKRFPSLQQEIEEDADFVSRVADDIVQEDVLVPLREKLWESMFLQPDLVGQQNTLDRNRLIVSQRSPGEFGISESMLNVQFNLVTTMMKQLSVVMTPTKYMDQLASIAKSIVLTIEANSRIGDAKRQKQQQQRAGSQQGSGGGGDLLAKSARISLSADDILPLYIYLLSLSQAPNLIFIREWVTRLSNGQECSERSYHFTVFCSAVEYILNGDMETIVHATSPQPSASHSKADNMSSRSMEIDSQLDSLESSGADANALKGEEDGDVLLSSVEDDDVDVDALP